MVRADCTTGTDATVTIEDGQTFVLTNQHWNPEVGSGAWVLGAGALQVHLGWFF